MCNCFLCDTDKGSRRVPQPPALPDVTDDQLAKMISESLESHHQATVAVGCSIAKVVRNDLQLADAIIVESMLDPLDLPNEYRKICIIHLMVSLSH